MKSSWFFRHITAPRLALVALAAAFGLAVSGGSPPDAADKIAAAIPERPYAAPAAPRRLLVFAVSNGRKPLIAGRAFFGFT